ncbi:MAG: glycogen synthase GlgA [Aerococcus sp.]|nr:glycogen synthase GlgA [Aerococcus sp.]
MKILFATSECAPFYKTGGLGDVASALPKALKQKGVDIRVVMPYYTSMPQIYSEQIEDVTHFYLKMGQREAYVGVKTLVLDEVTYYFIDNHDYFDRQGGLYGYEDDGERFGFFDLAVIEMMQYIDFIPNIIHVNDWQTAMIPVLLVDRYHWIEAYRNIRKVLTIHNIRFQGWAKPSILPEVFGTGFNTYHMNGVMHKNMVNFLKGGINFSDIVTTVSPSYADEIQTPAFGEGLDGVLRANHFKIRGIINGIDYIKNDPTSDPRLVANFNTKTFKLGKAKNKAALQEKVGLEVNPFAPLLGVVSRLTDQKGMQLISEKAEEILETTDAQFVVLGTGDAVFENTFRYFENRYPGRFCAYIAFDTDLAQLIYSGSDIFLMPSAFEPCGLSQMMAMRYGTLPLVHEIGGLKDTVWPYNQFDGTGNGFSFAQFTAYDFANVLRYALWLYHERQDDWDQLIRQAMTTDFSWDHPSDDYITMYEELLRS